MKIWAEPFGTLPDGNTVTAYTLENNRGLRVQVLNYGGIVRKIEVPDRQGKLDDVVLGYETLEDYLENPGYFGAVIGRNAGRTAGPGADIFGRHYPLESNSGQHNLHSGKNGLSFRLFSSEVHTINNLPVLVLRVVQEDLSDGFPGNLELNVIYAITDENALMIDYRAISDQTTVINLTNHSYFNLAGHTSGPVYGHQLQLDARYYTPAAQDGIPTGEVLSVTGTPLDFTAPKPVGKDISSSYPQVFQHGGFDHNYVLDGTDYRKIATLTEPLSGRAMEVYSDMPGLHVYTANSIDTECKYKDGARYALHQGLCLNTQFFPDAVHIPWFPSPVFGAQEEFSATTTYQFLLAEE